MKRTGLCLFLTVAIQGVCFAEVTKLPREVREVLKESSRFHEVLITTKLPADIVALCADGHGRLAEPGQKWEAGDAIMDANLPRKRLIWAAVYDEYYVVHYERGGIGHSFHVMVATLTKEDRKPKVVWRGVGGQLKDYAAFLGALRNGELDDRRDYAH